MFEIFNFIWRIIRIVSILFLEKLTFATFFSFRITMHRRNFFPFSLRRCFLHSFNWLEMHATRSYFRARKREKEWNTLRMGIGNLLDNSRYLNYGT